MLYLMNWLTCEFWTWTRGWQFDYSHGAGTSYPSNRSRNKRRNLWVGRCIFYWWPLFPSRNSYRTYIYIHRECRSVLVKLHPITVYRIVLGVRGSGVECHLLFSLVSPSMSFTMITRLILRCLWPLVFVLNNFLTLGMLRSAISHLPGCFCPWTFFQNIGFSMVPSDSFMSHLYTEL